MTLLCNSISFSRVCRDFGSKIQDFFHTSSKTVISFSRLKFIKEVSNIDLLKSRNKALTTIYCKCTCRRDWINFDQQEKNFNCKALDVAFKKLLTIFFRLNLYFPDFPSIWWANSTIFKEFNTLYKPYLFSFKIRLKKYNIINSCKSRRFEYFQYHRSLPVLQLQ